MNYSDESFCVHRNMLWVSTLALGIAIIVGECTAVPGFRKEEEVVVYAGIKHGQPTHGQNNANFELNGGVRPQLQHSSSGMTDATHQHRLEFGMNAGGHSESRYQHSHSHQFEAGMHTDHHYQHSQSGHSMQGGLNPNGPPFHGELSGQFSHNFDEDDVPQQPKQFGEFLSNIVTTGHDVITHALGGLRQVNEDRRKIFDDMLDTGLAGWFASSKHKKKKAGLQAQLQIKGHL